MDTLTPLFSRLEIPPDQSTKYTFHLSRKEAESVIDPTNAVLISITSPGFDQPAIHEEAWLDILSVWFDDVDRDDHIAIGGGFIPPDKNDAKAIAEFIHKHRNKHIVAHCLQGIGRSAAVCSVLINSGWTYLDYQPSGLTHANSLVIKLLKDEMEFFKNQQINDEDK